MGGRAVLFVDFAALAGGIDFWFLADCMALAERWWGRNHSGDRTDGET